LVVFATAAILVVGVALLLSHFAADPEETNQGVRGPLVSAVTGTTDRLTPGEAQAEPAVAPAGGRVQPSEEEWAQLLPRLEEVAAADPSDVNAQRKLALAYYNLGRFDEAAAIYRRLLADAEDAVLRNRLGNTLRDSGDAAGAEAAYQKAIADDPSLAPPYLNLAELLWRQGRDTEAMAIIDDGLGAVPEENRASLQEGRRVLEAAADSD